MTIFGKPWAELEPRDVEEYLAQADTEPLVWEAKGTDLVEKSELRRQVCGFANSHDGGYLILGAAKASDGKWQLRGVGFPDEARTWITDLIVDPDKGVRPRPDFDINSWSAPNGELVVVRVRPIATPPCMANGTVYERLPGKTQVVRDPLRLSDLFARGDAARKQAQAHADRAAGAVLGDWLEGEHGRFERPGVLLGPPEDIDPEQDERDYIRFTVGVAATGYPPNISSRLFRNSLAVEIWERLRDRPLGLPPGFGTSPDPVYWSQEALTWRHQSIGNLNAITVVRAAWDGSVAAGQKLATEDVYPDRFAEGRVGPHWVWANELVDRLGGYGDVYVTVLVAGRFPRVGKQRVVMRRGPLSPGVEPGHIASFGRELMRALGHPGEEPNASE